MKKVELRTEAELELFAAMLQYEQERVGLGIRFDSEANATIERIGENPLQFPMLQDGVRRALTRVFPYGIFFVVELDLVTILAVLHLHRHPDAWRKRL